ncbi:MAG: hypothetical protein RLZZ584_2130, partial [Pseudomonadota bacterium]
MVVVSCGGVWGEVVGGVAGRGGPRCRLGLR